VQGVGGNKKGVGKQVGLVGTERQRLAVELHDEKAQALAAALLGLKQVAQAATAREAGAANETTRELIQETIKGIREMAVDLRPRALDDFGLPPAVEQLAAGFARRTGIDVDVDIKTGRERLPPEIELTIYRAIQEVVQEAIRFRGTTLDDDAYVDLFGKPGEFQEELKVYGRAGLPCRRCRTPIETVRISQRTSYYCPQCQS